MDGTIEVTTERFGDVISITAAGRLDDTTTPDFVEAVRGVIAEGDRAVILDLGGITFATNAGLRAVLLLARELWGRGARLLLCALSPGGRRKFRVTGLEDLLPIHDSRAQALASLEEGGSEEVESPPSSYCQSDSP